MITFTACTPTVLASLSTETPQSGRSGQPCTLPASAGSPGNRTMSHGSLLHRISYNPGPAPGSGDHPQPPQQATSRPSSPLAAAQSSCHELISSTCFPPRKLGKPRPPALLWQSLKGVGQEPELPGARDRHNRSLPQHRGTPGMEGGKGSTCVFSCPFASG